MNEPECNHLYCRAQTGTACLDDLRAKNEALESRNAKLVKIIDEYAEHQPQCIRLQWESGEPTENGGYRTKIAGKWYSSKPIDETPKCSCGFDDALKENG